MRRKGTPRNVGASNPKSVLTPELVRQLRALANSLDHTGSFPSYSLLGRLYGIHRTTVGKCVLRHTWRHVEETET